MFLPYYMPPTLHIWSAPETPTPDMIPWEAYPTPFASFASRECFDSDTFSDHRTPMALIIIHIVSLRSMNA
ncbi:hypothetical protein L6452_04468 [Arctium lappa]|uniref:Uncharacterized protein n=1 Tax=Arctium lappa TaxID=4217 RepID=A0ACB9EDZ5_ARCLA|nr:hypothetical protein L6452_04468 [Arctium lappa]